MTVDLFALLHRVWQWLSPERVVCGFPNQTDDEDER
jgi:hypothetical protein